MVLLIKISDRDEDIMMLAVAALMTTTTSAAAAVLTPEAETVRQREWNGSLLSTLLPGGPP